MAHLALLFPFEHDFVLRLNAAIAVSRDHKPDQTDERQRIEEAGGFVMWAGMFLSPHFNCKFMEMFILLPRKNKKKKNKISDFWCLHKRIVAYSLMILQFFFFFLPTFCTSKKSNFHLSLEISFSIK